MKKWRGVFAINVNEESFSIYAYGFFNNQLSLYTKISDCQVLKEFGLNGHLMSQKVVSDKGSVLKAIVFIQNLLEDLCFSMDLNNELFDEEFYTELIAYLSYYNPIIGGFAPQKRYDFFLNYYEETKQYECPNCREQRLTRLYHSLRDFLVNFSLNIEPDEELVQFFYHRSLINHDLDSVSEVMRNSGIKLDPELVNEPLQEIYHECLEQNDLNQLFFVHSLTEIRPCFEGLTGLVNNQYKSLRARILQSITRTKSGFATINLKSLLHKLVKLYDITGVNPEQSDLIRIHNKLVDKEFLDSQGQEIRLRIKDLLIRVES